MHITKRSSVAGLLLALGVVACNNDSLTNLNKDPNSPASVPPGPVFTEDVRLAASRFLGSGFDLRQTEFVAQHWAEAQYPQDDQYSRLLAGSTQGTWNGAYQGELEDLNKLIKEGTANKDPGLSAPSQILQSWEFEFLTDTWGDIPYSQAFQGDSAGGSLTPGYDTQKSVYASLMAKLAKDATDLNTASNSLGSADPIYGGDPAGWQKFANSLHARLAMRLVNVDPTTADAELKAAFGAPGGVFTSNADAAILAWPGDGIYNNPMTDNFSGRDDHRVSQTLANILVQNNDPRTPIMMQPVQDSSLYPNGYGGMPNALSSAKAGTYLRTASRPGSYLYPGPTTFGYYGSPANKAYPSYFMTYAEVAFIEAEAAERGIGGLSGSAASYYNAGITASMQQFGVTDPAAIAAYLAQPGVAYKGGTAGLKQIAVQKWIALVDDGAQAWAEWRRTCQPQTIKAGPAAIVNYVPRRFYYPTTETSLNNTNLQAAIARQGADNFATRIYWDSNPTAAPTCDGSPSGIPGDVKISY